MSVFILTSAQGISLACEWFLLIRHRFKNTCYCHPTLILSELDHNFGRSDFILDHFGSGWYLIWRDENIMTYNGGKVVD